MRIQIDTTAKTIRVEQSAKFAELVNALDALFPDNAWREYNLLPSTGTTTNTALVADLRNVSTTIADGNASASNRIIVSGTPINLDIQAQ